MFCAHLFPFVSGEESNKSPLQAPDSMLCPFLYLIFNNKSYLARSITASFNNNKMHLLQGSSLAYDYTPTKVVKGF